jgi:hypothetical protein
MSFKFEKSFMFLKNSEKPLKAKFFLKNIAGARFTHSSKFQ